MNTLQPCQDSKEKLCIESLEKHQQSSADKPLLDPVEKPEKPYKNSVWALRSDYEKLQREHSDKKVQPYINTKNMNFRIYYS